MIATGTLKTPDGAADGAISLTNANGTVTARLDGFSTSRTGQLDLQLSPHPADAGKDNPAGCVLPTLVAATLDWKLDAPTIGFTVADGGARTRASGTVTSRDGHPATYTVAPGDDVPAIATRFGISMAALFYLNPYDGTLDPNDPTAAANLKYGTLINLALDARGGPAEQLSGRCIGAHVYDARSL